MQSYTIYSLIHYRSNPGRHRSVTGKCLHMQLAKHQNILHV